MTQVDLGYKARVTLEIEWHPGWYYSPSDERAGQSGAPAGHIMLDEDEIENLILEALADNIFFGDETRFRVAALEIDGESKGAGVWMKAEY